MVIPSLKCEANSSEDLDGVRAKPLKRRGLSKFYSSKSQSFTSFDAIRITKFGDSSLALAKYPSSSSQIEESHISPPNIEDTLLLRHCKSNNDNLECFKKIVSPRPSEQSCITDTYRNFEHKDWMRVATEDLCSALHKSQINSVNMSQEFRSVESKLECSF